MPDPTRESEHPCATLSITAQKNGLRHGLEACGRAGARVNPGGRPRQPATPMRVEGADVVSAQTDAEAFARRRLPATSFIASAGDSRLPRCPVCRHQAEKKIHLSAGRYDAGA